MTGQFITFEGGEGAGKSTQIARLKAHLEKLRIPVFVTREPGGSPGAEVVRSVLLSGKARALGPDTEAMLFAAARADHMDSIILPALERDEWVLCDRFTDSTRVYQGEAGVDPAFIRELENLAVAGKKPDLTVLIDVPPNIGLARVSTRSATESASGAPDRFEKDDLEVQVRRQAMFLDLAKAEPDRIAVVDGSKSADTVEEAIWALVRERLGHRLEDATRVVPLIVPGTRDG
ncbi:dTMP kinase [Rhizobiales bacterium]|uniref:dTMP kinase n=1 Tax=Hongsoonwoonella zoysiae TaxID=2821844 RepID=UPI0015611950|nr:dTMP kinase [Hongsoonwoonella zoysiae]